MIPPTPTPQSVANGGWGGYGGDRRKQSYTAVSTAEAMTSRHDHSIRGEKAALAARPAVERQGPRRRWRSHSRFTHVLRSVFGRHYAFLLGKETRGEKAKKPVEVSSGAMIRREDWNGVCYVREPRPRLQELARWPRVRALRA